VEEVDGAFGEYPGAKAVKKNIRKAEEFSAEIRTMLFSAEFQKLSAKKQKALLAARVEEADSATKLRDIGARIGAEYGLVVGEATKKGTAINRIDFTEPVDGIMLGVVSIESIAAMRKKIKKASDIILKAGGLCLAIDPSMRIREEHGLDVTQLVYIPVVEISGLADRKE
jgi:hypothetical protein